MVSPAQPYQGPTGREIPRGGVPGQILKRGTGGDGDVEWGNGTQAPMALGDLTDVSAATPVLGDLLLWDGIVDRVAVALAAAMRVANSRAPGPADPSERRSAANIAAHIVASSDCPDDFVAPRAGQQCRWQLIDDFRRHHGRAGARLERIVDQLPYEDAVEGDWSRLATHDRLPDFLIETLCSSRHVDRRLPEILAMVVDSWRNVEIAEKFGIHESRVTQLLATLRSERTRTLLEAA